MIPIYNNESTGRPAYDPRILLKILLFAYSKGITSSRDIEWCCQTNIIFKALSCDTVPHYTTIASFASGSPDEIEAVFVPQGIFSCFTSEPPSVFHQVLAELRSGRAIHLKQILLTCDQQGLLGHELLAIDGCKMQSDASKEWSGTFKELEQKREKIKRHIQYHMSEQKKWMPVKSRRKIDNNEPSRR